VAQRLPVGSTRDLSVPFDHESADNDSRCEGDAVRVEFGVREGDVYEYLGDDVTVEFDYTSAQSPATITKGDRVKRLAGGGFAEAVFEYTGATPLTNPNLGNGSQYANERLWRRINAIDQDFANPDVWKLVNIDSAPLQVLAYIENTPVDAGGALSLTARGDQSIDAFVFAGSVAIAGGLFVGIAASGAGAASDNRITTHVNAYIDGNDTVDSVITATSVSLLATDQSDIQSDTAAVSVAAALGIAGVAISIGVSLANNSVDSSVDAYIADADVTAETGARSW
jgi:hypothetical protein